MAGETLHSSFPTTPDISDLTDIVDATNDVMDIPHITGATAQRIPVSILAGLSELTIGQLRDLALDVYEIAMCLNRYHMERMSDVDLPYPEVYQDPGSVATKLLMKANEKY